MEGEEEVLMSLDRLSASLLVRIDPTFDQFMNERGEMTLNSRKCCMDVSSQLGCGLSY